MTAVPCGYQRLQRREEGRCLVEAQPETGVLAMERLVGLLAGSHRFEIGGEVRPLARVQPEAVAPIEPVDDRGKRR